MVNARWCNYTDKSVERDFPKCLKGVTQRLKLIPVKTHEAHTFYEYDFESLYDPLSFHLRIERITLLSV